MALKGAPLALFALLISFLLLFGCPQNNPGAAQNGTGVPAPPPVPNLSKNPGGTPSPPPPVPAKLPFVALVNVSEYPSSTSEEKTIKETVGSFDRNDETTLDNVRKISALGPAAADAILPLLADGNVYAQWAGLEALGPIIPQADAAQREKIRQALLPLLQSKRASIRVYAAFSLLYLGEKSALPVMVDSLNNTDRLLASEPPAQVCEVANAALVLHTDNDFSFTCSQDGFDADAKTAWESWWQSSKDSLTFDKGKRKFVGG